MEYTRQELIDASLHILNAMICISGDDVTNAAFHHLIDFSVDEADHLLKKVNQKVELKYK